MGHFHDDADDSLLNTHFTTSINVSSHRPAAAMHYTSTADYAAELLNLRSAVEKLDGTTHWLQEVDDATLLRFLKARSMNTDKAAKMFVHFQTWRASYVPLGYIPASEVTTELAADKIALQGPSKKGWPLIVAFACKHYANKHDFETFKRFVIHLLDKTIASAPSGIEKIMVILDLNHLGYKNLDVKGFITGFQLLQNYYPERLGILYMVNTPKLFLSVWRMISHFLDQATREKIVFLENHNMAPVLLSEVDTDTLPALYGGKAEIVLLQDVHLDHSLSP